MLDIGDRRVSLPLRLGSGHLEISRLRVELSQIGIELRVVHEGKWLVDLAIGRLHGDYVHAATFLVSVPVTGPFDRTFHLGVKGMVLADAHVVTGVPLETSLPREDLIWTYLGATPAFDT